MPKKKSQDKLILDLFDGPFIVGEDTLESSGGASNKELRKQLKKIAGKEIFSPSDLEKEYGRSE